MKNPNVSPSPGTTKRHVLAAAWTAENAPEAVGPRGGAAAGAAARAGGLGLVGPDGGRIHPLGGNQRRRLSSQYNSLQHPQAHHAWGNAYLP